MNREKHLIEQGWSEPLDESPVEIPDSWEGGSVQNTGGHIYCRIWRNEKRQLEVIYNLDNEHVALSALRWDEDYGYHDNGDYVKTVKADNDTDEELMKEAKKLMEEFR